MFDVLGDAVVIVMSTAKRRRRENFGRKGMSSDGVWICVATVTMWHVPAGESMY